MTEKGKGEHRHRLSLTTLTNFSPPTRFFSFPRRHQKQKLVSTESILDRMNRPGTSSLPCCVSWLIVDDRSTSPTTTKPRSRSWHWRPFQRPIYDLCPSSKNSRLSRSGSTESPHDTKFGPTVHPNEFCATAYPRFPLRRRESSAAT